jgi:hypothetical protein
MCFCSDRGPVALILGKFPFLLEQTRMKDPNRKSSIGKGFSQKGTPRMLVE